MAPPTPDVVARLVAAAPEAGSDFGMFVRLAAVTGASRGELCALRWPDSAEPSVTIGRALADIGGAVSEKPTETRQARRTALDQHTLDAPRHPPGLPRTAGPSLRCHPGPGRLRLLPYRRRDPAPRPDQASSRFCHLTRTLDVPQVRLMTSATSRPLPPRRRRPGQTVSQRLGHTTPTTTLNAYSHYQRPSDQHAADILGQIPD